VGVDDDAFDTGLDEVIHCIGDHRAVGDGEHGFGVVISQWAKSGAKTGAEDESGSRVCGQGGGHEVKRW
jgi:hypothetical protein